MLPRKLGIVKFNKEENKSPQPQQQEVQKRFNQRGKKQSKQQYPENNVYMQPQNEEEINMNLNNQKFGDIYATSISNTVHQIENLKNLQMRNNRLTDKGILDVVQNISKQTEELDFSYNDMKIDNFISIIQIISGVGYKIRILKLENTKIVDTHVEIISKHLSSSSTLQILDLSKNNITYKGCKPLEKLISSCGDFKEIYLHYNKINSEGGIYIIDGARNNGFVKVIDFSQNSLGLGVKRHKFIDSLCKLIKNYCGDKNIVHLDLSYNQFHHDDCLLISLALKQNHSIIGIHFQGNNWYIDARGNMKFDPDNIEKIDTIPTLPKKIDGVKFTGFNEKRMKGQLGDDNIIRSGDNCWICESWQEITFKWVNGESSSHNFTELYLNLEIDEFKPCQMNVESDHFWIKRMLPPRCIIRYYYTLDGNQVILAENQEIIILKKPIQGYFKNVDNQQKEKFFLTNNDQKLDTQKQNDKPSPPLLTKLHIIKTADKPEAIFGPDYNLLIDCRTRTKYQKGRKDHKKKKQNKWVFQNSNFKDYRGDDEVLLNKCFEEDINNSKINSMIKNEDINKLCKLVLKKYYPYIKNMYKYLSFQSFYESPNISLQLFNDFIRTTNTVDDKTPKITDIEMKFMACISASKFKKMKKEDKGLIRYQFMEIIIRLAEQKYLMKDQYKKMDAALEALFDNGYFQGLDIQLAQDWRENNLWNQENDQMLGLFSQLIKSVYKNYCGISRKKSSGLKMMYIDDFKQVISDCGLFKEKITDTDCNICYGLSCMSQPDEITQDRYLLMSQVEFIEALARVAEKTINYRYDDAYKRREFLQKLKGQSNEIEQLSEEQIENGTFLPTNDNLQVGQKLESLMLLLFDCCGDKEILESFPLPSQSQYKVE